jgi:hypothetical protein
MKKTLLAAIGLLIIVGAFWAGRIYEGESRVRAIGYDCVIHAESFQDCELGQLVHLDIKSKRCASIEIR